MSLLFAGSSAGALQDPAVAQLTAWGYPVPACVEALQRLKGDPEAAHQDLFARLSGALPVPCFCCLTRSAHMWASQLFEYCCVPVAKISGLQLISCAAECIDGFHMLRCRPDICHGRTTYFQSIPRQRTCANAKVTYGRLHIGTTNRMCLIGSQDHFDTTMTYVYRVCSTAGIEQADPLEEDAHEGVALAEWQSDVEGLVAVYDMLVSVPSHTSLVYAAQGMQVTAGMQGAVKPLSCVSGLQPTSCASTACCNKAV